LKQEKEEVMEKLQVAQSCVTTYEKEKDEIQVMLEEDKEKLQKEKKQLLAKQNVVKEVVTKEIFSVLGLAQEELESIDMQVGKLVESIQKLQSWVMELELQEVRDQRDEGARNIVGRIRSLTS
jgi:hypothetical protein